MERRVQCVIKILISSFSFKILKHARITNAHCKII